MMTAYDVNVTRDGRWWMVEIPALDGLTQARRLSEVRTMASEWIAVTLDVPLSSVELGEVMLTIGAKDVSTLKAEVEQLRQAAQNAEAEAARAARELAKALAAEDVPVRDIGEILGVSFQRASQLVNA